MRTKKYNRQQITLLSHPGILFHRLFIRMYLKSIKRSYKKIIFLQTFNCPFIKIYFYKKNLNNKNNIRPNKSLIFLFGVY